MHRYQILIEYVGSNYRGWQIQKKGQTIQGVLQDKISKLLKKRINIVGSGRTDAGVHAVCQSAHFDYELIITNKDKFLKWSCHKITKEWSFTWVNNAVSKDLYKDKIKKYSLWNHDNCIIPMAFDSSGNIAPKSKSFINKLYATSTGENGSHVQRNWNSETQRRYLKKNFLDSISLLFAKFKVKDIQNMEKVPLQHRLDQEAARDPHEQERRRRLE